MTEHKSEVETRASGHTELAFVESQHTVEAERKVQQISDRLGFRNQSHFGTFFKRQTGLSPKAFKQQVM